jgi:hypothetical protein
VTYSLLNLHGNSVNLNPDAGNFHDIQWIHIYKAQLGAHKSHAGQAMLIET